VILVLAHYLAPRMTQFRGLRHTLVPLGIVAVPLLLILIHPPWVGGGTGPGHRGAILGRRAAPLDLRRGLRARVLICVVGYPHLKDYQKERIKTFVDPAPTRVAKAGISSVADRPGSGELFGQALGPRHANDLPLPARVSHDFIFPTVASSSGWSAACRAGAACSAWLARWSSGRRGPESFTGS